MADKRRSNSRNVNNSRRNKNTATNSRTRSSGSYRSFQPLDRDEILRDANLERSYYYDRQSGNSRSTRRSENTQPKKKKTIRVKKSNLNPVRSIQYNLPSTNYTHIDNSKISRETREKRQRIGRVTNLFFGFLFICMFIYLIGYSYTFLINSNTDVSNDIIKYGTIEAPQSFQGVIIRSEEVYTAGAEGVVNYNIAENEKIKSKTIVCSVSNAEVVADMEKELEEINQSILKLQESRQEISIFTEDVKKYNQQIKEIIDETAPTFVEGDISKLYTLKNNVQKKIDVRNQMLLSESNGSLAELAGKRATQESKLEANITKITAKTSGIVSYYVDGLENTFTVDKLPTLTKEQTLMKGDENLIKTNVTNDSPVFKLVTSNQWYIAAYINNKYVDNWAAGEHHNIYVTDSYDNTTTINTTVESITTLEKDSYVVLKADKYILDFINDRTITFETTEATEGYKIPNSAIVEQTLLKVPVKYVSADGKVIKSINGEISTLNVTTSTESGDIENVYIPLKIGTINVGDTLINPDNNSDSFKITDTLTKQGVFIMNTGIAEFAVINTANSVSNGTYTVLDPTVNPRITIYDKIITDTENVEKQQRIYG